GEDPSDLALSDSGLIFVIDSDGGTNAIGALYTVDPSTGNRVLISDFGNIADGPLGSLPRGVTVTNSGDVLVTDRDAGTDGYGALFKVDPVTGARVMVSDFGNNAQGPLGRAMDIKEDNSGNIFVVVRQGASGVIGVMKVNVASGNRTLISDFENAAQGPTGVGPLFMAVESTNNLVVTDNSIGDGYLFRVNPTTGNRSVLSDFGDNAQGPLGANIHGVAVEASGSILVTDVVAPTEGAVFRVCPVTGNRIILSDIGDGSQGPLGSSPEGAVVVPGIDMPIPALNPWGTVVLVLIMGSLTAWFIRKGRQERVC
ncbi:MAG: IPTL-CTERM sorting domain-containing protein, partial [Deltaproteobacteria bacterium]|nr:IPTL-CTERM sorting domain-containing protein [Deltaproteobacteria bacterium]